MDNHEFLGQKVLVTGASGFIGSHLCHRLCTYEVEVHGISREQRRGDGSSICWWQGDLADLSAVRNIVRAVRPKVVFHLASYVTGERNLDTVIPTFRSNLASTVNLLVAASESECPRVVLTGSMKESEPEDLMDFPCSPYAVAKWASSAYGRLFHAHFKLPVVMLRVFMVYGPAQRDLRKLVPYVILSLLRGEVPRLTSGQRDIDWVYVEDVVEAFLAAGQVDGIEGKTLNIGSGTLVSIRTIVDYLVQQIDPQIKPHFGAIPDRQFEHVRVSDTAKSHAALGWRAVIPLEEGLERTVKWYEQYRRLLQ